MEITTVAFEHDGPIPVEYTIDGEARFVPLTISDAPSSTASLVIISDDPDCPPDKVPGGLFDHWLVWNIDPSTTTVESADSVGGITGTNGWGDAGYAVPEPPPGHGEHRYFFKVFALDQMLDLPAGASRAELLAAIDSHVIASAELIGRYTRQQ